MATGAEVAEEVVEEVTEVMSASDAGLLFGGIGFALGFAGGYFLLKKRLERYYFEMADAEIANMREHYNAKHTALESEKEKLNALRTMDAEKKKGQLDEVVEDLKYRTEGDGRVAYHQVESDPGVERTTPEEFENAKNIFNQPQPDVELPEWDYAEEVKTRRKDVPYIIHRDEYAEGYPEHEQHTFTYFEGDDVLADERDQVIAQEEVVGLGNLSKFGHGSGDPSIVYIRNETMKVDIEVVHSDGKFATEVHGFQEDELQHSSMRRRSPRRSDYDASD